MRESIVKRLGNLLNVKSLVTLVLTAVFAVMALRGTISQDFMTVYAVVIAFYFGTQSQKVQEALEAGSDSKSTIVIDKESIHSSVGRGGGNGNGKRVAGHRQKADRYLREPAGQQPHEVWQVVWPRWEPLVHDVCAVVL